ncbi:hypothetical protein HYH02_011737 [Chlamydomonas schloesseri]|uniref:Uncharacterized protein n=1 Tax=Chlamydomonas schloesseri TaxID=2026947 RepID=A0A835TDQ5_9CHLO|nr:hypothetical protein HYH02_011737 [Chlamydomonas schloesseri]|eukprot:KAG2436025.1 hypothetical protein HYH02_011737 [Chlamydomonas schloesseri]
MDVHMALDPDDAVRLGAEEVAGLAALPALQHLILRCHDPSPAGANLAALIGGRRPPALRCLELISLSIAKRTGSDERLRLPPLLVECGPSSQGGRMASIATYDDYCGGDDGELNPGVVDRLAQALVAAAQSLPPGEVARLRLRLRTYAVSRRAIRWQAGHDGPEVGGDADEEEDEEAEGGAVGGLGTEQRLAQYLGPGGHLPRLLALIGGGHVEVDHMDASTAVSPAAACAVVRVLGLPHRELHLHHGTVDPRGPKALGGSGGRAAGEALQMLRTAGQAGQEQAATELMQQQQQQQQQAAPAAQQAQGRALTLDALDAEGMLQEAVERLWLAATAVAASAPNSSSSSGGGSSRMVLLRGVPSLAPPPPPLAPRPRRPSKSERLAECLSSSSVALLLDGLLCPEPAPAALVPPSRRIDARQGFAYVPCAQALLVECVSEQDAAALVEQVRAAGTGGARSDASVGVSAGEGAGAGAGTGGGSGAGTGTSSSGAETLAAAALPACFAKTASYFPWSCCADAVQKAVLTVLADLWAGAEAQAAAASACRASGGGGGPAAAAAGSRHGLGGAVLDRVRLLLELDAAAAGLWGAARYVHDAIL